MVQAHLNQSLSVSTILVTMYDARTRLAAGVADEVREHFGDAGPQDLDPALGAGLGGAVVRPDRDDLRSRDRRGRCPISRRRARSRPREHPPDEDGQMSTANRPPQRRGLGRGLGSLIPTAPPTTGADAGAADAGDASPATAGAVDGLAVVAGTYFAELPVGQITPNRVQPRQVFDEEAMAELVHSIREIGVLQPVVVRKHGPEDYELVMGERRLARVPGGRPRGGPRDRSRDRRRRHAARRAAGEPAPLPAQPAGGGGGLLPDAGGLRLHPRGAGQSDRTVPSPDQQHPATPQAHSGRPAPGGGRGPVGRTCSRVARRSTIRTCRTAWLSA